MKIHWVYLCGHTHTESKGHTDADGDAILDEDAYNFDEYF